MRDRLKREYPFVFEWWFWVFMVLLVLNEIAAAKGLSADHIPYWVLDGLTHAP